MTVGVAANAVHLRPQLGFGRGFEHYECEFAKQTFGDTPPFFLTDLLRQFVVAVYRPADIEPLFWTAADVNRRALSFLEAAGSTGKPFFLFLNYMDAHNPYVPPPPFDTRYGALDSSFRWSGYSLLRDAVSIRRARTMDDRTRAHLESQYDGAIAYLDQELHELFARLRVLGLYDNTLIIVTSDHGEGFGERSMVGHGLSLYQHEVHVPLMLKYPHSAAGTVVDTPVGSVDILPTVLDVIGSPTLPGLDGISLRRAPSVGQRWILSESSRLSSVIGGSTRLQPVEIAMVNGSLKLIARNDGHAELFDLSTDPHEGTDVSRGRSLPQGWQLIMNGLTGIEPGSENQAPPDPMLLERLRSLGYLR